MVGVPHLSKHSTMYCVIVVNYVVHVYVVEVFDGKKYRQALVLRVYLKYIAQR